MPCVVPRAAHPVRGPPVRGPVAADVRARARSGSHAVGVRLPLVGRSVGRRRPVRRPEPSARTASRPTPCRCSSRSCRRHASEAARRPALEPVLMGGRPFLANAQSAVFSPFNAPGVRAAALALAGADRRAEALRGGARDLPARPGDRHALRRRPAGRDRLRLQPLDVTWVSWPTHERLGLPALALPARRPLRASPGPLAVRRPGRRRRRCSTSADTPSPSFHVLAFTVSSGSCGWSAAPAPRRPGARASARSAARGRRHRVGGAHADPVLRAALALGRPGRAREPRRRRTPPRYLLGLFLHDFWGRQTRIDARVPRPAGGERAYYVGALPLMLGGRRADRCARARASRAWQRWALVLPGGGDRAPPVLRHGDAAARLLTADNGRLAVIFVLCIALLAGLGLDDLMGEAREPPAPARARSRASRCSSLPLVGWRPAAPSRRVVLWPGAPRGLGVRRPSDPRAAPRRAADRRSQTASLLEWLVLAGAALVLLALRLRGRLRPTPFARLAVALVGLRPLQGGHGLQPSDPVSTTRVQPATPAIRYLQAQRPAPLRRPATRAPLEPAARRSPPNVAMRYRPLRRARLRLSRSNAAIERSGTGTGARPGCLLRVSAPSPARDAARRCERSACSGVTHLLQNRSDEPLRAPGCGPPTPDPTPASTPTRTRCRAPSWSSASRGARRQRGAGRRRLHGFRARRGGRHRAADPGLPEASARRDRRPAGPTSSPTSDERVVVDTAERPRALLVLTDSDYPGWKATVDGTDAPRASRRLPAPRRLGPAAATTGSSSRYQPASWRAGWIVSLSHPYRAGRPVRFSAGATSSPAGVTAREDASPLFAYRLALIVAVGVAIRIVYTVLVAPWPPWYPDDSEYFHRLATLLANGHGFTQPFPQAAWDGPTAYHPPLYPVLLAGVAKLGGNGDVVQRLTGSLFGAGTIAAVGLLARRPARRSDGADRGRSCGPVPDAHHRGRTRS